MKCLTLSAFILFGCVQLFGQESRKEITVGFRVSHSALDASFGDNAQRLAEITSFLNEVKGDSTLDLVEVAFCGSASPEGSISLNRRLAAKRRAALEDYVRRRVELPDSLVRRIDNVIAWERLTRLVEQSDMAGREDVLDVLRNEPEFTFDRRGALVDSRKKHLMDLHGGRSWHYMLRHFYPELRNASAVIITVHEVVPPVEPEPVAEADTVAPPPPAPVDTVVPAPVVEPDPKKPFYMAVKTNMLYDLLAVPNLGVEFYLGKGWSVSGNWMYGWWKSDSRHRFWRVYGGELAVRKWFGRQADAKPLMGHHLGLYGQIFTYDFEWGGKGYLGGKPGETLWDSPNYAAGVEYGYSLPIARRLNLDFALGVGYWGGKYYKYIPRDGHYVWQTTRNRHWFGPTKAEVSLVWLIGRGNTNSTKGGAK